MQAIRIDVNSRYAHYILYPMILPDDNLQQFADCRARHHDDWGVGAAVKRPRRLRPGREPRQLRRGQGRVATEPLVDLGEVCRGVDTRLSTYTRNNHKQIKSKEIDNLHATT